MSAREEPKTVRLWRAIIARRDFLVAEIAHWERAGAIDGVEPWREQLAALDRDLRAAARDEPNERGPSMSQLRRWAGEDRSSELRAARALLTSWLRSRNDVVLRQRAKRLLARLAAHGASIDLDALVEEDRRLRSSAGGSWSGAARKIAERIVARVHRGAGSCDVHHRSREK